ncbi:hypothetical protein JYB62_15570 [Algoriphagus lutimaris]|nr:hypothetical protein [Algoriphagus lutimaris]MBN3521429.1 hypothetical protein [Algoriphagus lutimaris]
MKARGGFSVDFAWDFGKITNATIRSEAGGPCNVLLPNGGNIVDEDGHEIVRNSGEKPLVVSFQTEKVTTYLMNLL